MTDNSSNQATLELPSETKHYSELLELAIEFGKKWCRWINRAIITVRDNDVLFMAVGNDRDHEIDLSDALEQFESLIAGNPQFESLKFSTVCLPDSNIETVGEHLKENYFDITPIINVAKL